MKNEKTDIRSRFTKKAICSAVLFILKEKRLKDISVSEICKNAEINRSTFYNHFYDIYDVYEYIEGSFYEEIINKFDKIKFYRVDYPFFIEIMNLIVKNSDFAKLIISNIGESSLVKSIISYLKNKYIADFLEFYPNLEKEKLETMFTYIVNGSIGIIVDWLQKDNEVLPSAIASQISRFNSIILSGYLS